MKNDGCLSFYYWKRLGCLCFAMCLLVYSLSSFIRCRFIGNPNVCMFIFLMYKHVYFSSHSITQDVSLVDTCDSAEMFLSDGIILTGSATGKSASTEELRTLLAMSNLPCLVGSGVTDQNFHEFSSAHALIVGSYFKQGGLWENELCVERIKHFMQMVSSFRDSWLVEIFWVAMAENLCRVMW